LAVGLDVEHDRLVEANPGTDGNLLAVGEAIPVEDNAFDLILCNEVLEHVTDDRETVEEMLRVLRPGGRMIIFVPNRGYPFETHGIYRKGVYRFGNKFGVNYLPRTWRDKLAPHVRIYAYRDMVKLFADLPLKPITRTVIFGGYDNIVVRFGAVGKVFRAVLQTLEHTPLKVFGLSHLWVMEKEN
jgi:SAM-dependent methyltransferase